MTARHATRMFCLALLVSPLYPIANADDAIAHNVRNERQHRHADTPTPYPARAQDWPGSGVIRVFDWMPDRRKKFWRERAEKQGSIVFAGDSLTEGWLSLSADFPGARLANRAIGGDVSRGLLFRFDEDVLALGPRAIVILIGINDLTAKQPAADTLSNIERMLDLKDTKLAESPVVLCTVPPSAHPKAPVDSRQRQLLNQGLQAIAAKRDRVVVVDLFRALAARDGSPAAHFFAPDRLHFSKQGYARWKQALLPALRELDLL